MTPVPDLMAECDYHANFLLQYQPPKGFSGMGLRTLSRNNMSPRLHERALNARAVDVPLVSVFVSVEPNDSFFERVYVTINVELLELVDRGFNFANLFNRSELLLNQICRCFHKLS